MWVFTVIHKENCILFTHGAPRSSKELVETCLCISDRSGIWGEGKTGVPREKPRGARERTNNKLNSHMASPPGFEPGPRWWEASALTTVPPSTIIHSKKESFIVVPFVFFLATPRKDSAGANPRARAGISSQQIDEKNWQTGIRCHFKADDLRTGNECPLSVSCTDY